MPCYSDLVLIISRYEGICIEVLTDIASIPHRCSTHHEPLRWARSQHRYAKLAVAISNAFEVNSDVELLDRNIENFEGKMFERAGVAAERSERNMRQFLGNNEELESVIMMWSKMLGVGAPK